MRKLYEIVEDDSGIKKDGDMQVTTRDEHSIKWFTIRPVKEWTKLSEQKPKQGQEVEVSYENCGLWILEKRFYTEDEKCPSDKLFLRPEDSKWKEYYWRPFTPPEEEDEFEKWWENEPNGYEFVNTAFVKGVCHKAWNAARGKV